jgi:hypothetical protein
MFWTYSRLERLQALMARCRALELYLYRTGQPARLALVRRRFHRLSAAAGSAPRPAASAATPDDSRPPDRTRAGPRRPITRTDGDRPMFSTRRSALGRLAAAALAGLGLGPRPAAPAPPTDPGPTLFVSTEQLALMEELCRAVCSAAGREIHFAARVHGWLGDCTREAVPDELDRAAAAARDDRFAAAADLAEVVFEAAGRTLPDGNDESDAWEAFGAEIPGFAVWLWPDHTEDTFFPSVPRVFVIPTAGLVKIGADPAAG